VGGMGFLKLISQAFPRPLPQSPLVFSRSFARFIFRSRSTVTPLSERLEQATIIASTITITSAKNVTITVASTITIINMATTVMTIIAITISPGFIASSHRTGKRHDNKFNTPIIIFIAHATENHFVIHSTLSVVLHSIFNPLESISHISLTIVVAFLTTSWTPPAVNTLQIAHNDLYGF